MEQKIGRLQRVPLREVWPHEAHSLTPWLLRNADALGEVLGMNLELHTAEHAVGGFSLDLIGVDTVTGETVIVENQLEVSDHTHLGQVLTYAGGTDATNIVWLAPRFRDEHRAALEWLNNRTDASTRFFAVQLDAVRIGHSAPAPLLELVVRPNDWEKAIKAAVSPSRRPQWERDDLLAAVAASDGEPVADAVAELLNAHAALGPEANVFFGRGERPSVTAEYQADGRAVQPWSIWARDGAAHLSLNFGYMVKGDEGVTSSAVEALVARLAPLPGVTEAATAARETDWRKRPALPLAPVLSTSSGVAPFHSAFAALYATIRRVS